MRVRNVKIQDFRSIKDFSADLDDDKRVVLVRGSNGSGKSSVLKAINYILFNVKQDESSVKDFIRRGCRESRIEAGFTGKDSDFGMHAVVGEKGNSRSLVLDNQMFENSQVVKKLEAVLPGYGVGVQASTSFQGMTDLITATPAERRNMLESIYQLDFSNEVTRLKEDISSANSRVVEIDKQVYHLEQSIQTPTRVSRTMKWSEEEVAAHESEIQTLNARIMQADGQQDILLAIDAAATRHKAALDAIPKSEPIVDSCRPTGRNAAVHEVNQLTTMKGIAEKNVWDLDSRIATENTNLSWYEKKVCPSCGKPIDDADSRIAELRPVIESLAAQRQEAGVELSKIKAMLAAESSRIETLDASRKKFRQRVEHVRRERESMRKARERADDLGRQYADLVALRPEACIDASELRVRVQVLSEELKAYREQEQRRKLVEEANQRILEANKRNQAEAVALRAEKTACVARVARDTGAMQVLQRDFPTWILLKETRHIESEMNRFLDEVYDGRYHVSMEIAKTGIAITYNDGADVSLASGAERDLMNIAFKIALSRLSGMRMMFLDEVDKFCDVDKARKLFLWIVHQVRDGLLDQVFVVTHSADMQALLEAREEVQVLEMGD